MSRLIYIVPWAICDTEHLYLKRTEQNGELPKKYDSFEDWTIQEVIPNPDRRSKDVYIVLDVYCGYDFKGRNREVSILDITNSVSHLTELGYEPADETDQSYIRQRVLKWDKPIRIPQGNKKRKK